MRSMLSAVDALKAALPKATVRTCGPADVTAGALEEESAALLVMPGGADLPYTRDLAGDGVASIRGFIESGGSYLGLCAGAYYATARVDFEPGHPSLSVAGRRDLALFPGAALGAAVPGFEYESEAGAAASRLAWRDVGAPTPGHSPEAAVSATFPASVRDYCNGGPVFTCLNGRPWAVDSGPADAEAGAPCGSGDAVWVDVIARYDGPTTARADASSAQTSPAPAAAAAGGVAALRARFPHNPSAGVAILCGTHPELVPASAWLSTGGADVKADTLAAVLESCAEERAAFWRALLVAAGCGELM